MLLTPQTSIVPTTIPPTIPPTMPTTIPTTIPTPASTDEMFFRQVAELIFSLTNQNRANVGVSALTWDEGLYSIADGHAREMAQYQYLNHVNKEGRTAMGRALEYGLNLHGFAENIAFNGNEFDNPNAVAAAFITLWMNSDEHRQNILDGDMTHLGVSVRKGENGYYAVQNFCFYW
jgi:uncharacterized protein YkwD